MKKPELDKRKVEVFIKNIQRRLDDKDYKHKDYLREVLNDFSVYKKKMDNIFCVTQSPNFVYHFRALYRKSRKTIWRDIETLGKNSLYAFAEAIICSMDWENDHMHGFSSLIKNRGMYNTYTEFSIFAPVWDDDPYITYKTNKIFDYSDEHKFFIIFKSMCRRLK